MSLSWFPPAHPTKTSGSSHATSRLRRPSLSGTQVQPRIMDSALEINCEDFNLKIERQSEMFHTVDVSVSAYDTAWVAMVPSSVVGSSSHTPLFPQCLKWVLENQRGDGSFDDFQHQHPSLLRSSLTSALACVLALKKWNIGEGQIEKGLSFIESNFETANKVEEQYSPVGFDIIFPGLLEYAIDQNLNLPLNANHVQRMLEKRDEEFRRISKGNCDRKGAYLARCAEGLGKLLEWEDVILHQRKNGSLFNSPSTTAATLINLKDKRCLEYLTELLSIFQDAVPIIYPLDIYARLLVVDSIEKLGIHRYFRNEIGKILDDTHRCWLNNDEDIFSDIVTIALAFRLLRMNGYDVSSDIFQRLNETSFATCMERHPNDIVAVLELYKASQITAKRNEPVLEDLRSWSSSFLKQKVSTISQGHEFTREIVEEVNYALKFPFHLNLERLSSRRNIESSITDCIQMQKTAYRIHNVNHKSFKSFAVRDFTACQSKHREELAELDRWVKENRLDHLTFARQKLSSCYFSTAATLFSPEMSAARISWAKNAVLTTVVDDFFDIGGSREELQNLIKLVENLDASSSSECCSTQVEIIYSALHDTINELSVAAMSWQGRNVWDHLKTIWLDLLKSMMKESEWTMDKKVPSVDEYMNNAYVSFALGPIILPSLYFVGPIISEETVRLPEYGRLFYLTSTCGRLLNDIQGFEREDTEGKINSLSLYMTHHGFSTKEETIDFMKRTVHECRQELLGLVLETGTSRVPRACKDLFWKMCRILHLFYANTDGFTSPKEMMGAIHAVIHEPIALPSSVKELCV